MDSICNGVSVIYAGPGDEFDRVTDATLPSVFIRHATVIDQVACVPLAVILNLTFPVLYIGIKIAPVPFISGYATLPSVILTFLAARLSTERYALVDPSNVTEPVALPVSVNFIAEAHLDAVAAFPVQAAAVVADAAFPEQEEEVVAFPERDAVIIRAAKSPFASLFTILLAVFTFVASDIFALV